MPRAYFDFLPEGRLEKCPKCKSRHYRIRSSTAYEIKDEGAGPKLLKQNYQWLGKCENCSRVIKITDHPYVLFSRLAIARQERSKP